ncbi:MAG TPA: hypothetical protein DCQ94_02795 [Nitrospira sp.]|jgi:2'-5' RNA ligase|nr:hypothetical protein [Nitrospira sp.]
MRTEAETTPEIRDAPSEASEVLVPELHSFALVPEGPLADLLAAQRARFDPVHAAVTVPHVTMKLACMLNGSALPTHEALITWLARECLKQPPFPVHLGEVGTFESCNGHGHVLYIAVRATAPLIELHDRLVQRVALAGVKTAGLSIEREVAMFFPHLTLAQGLSADAAREVLSIAKREHVASAFVADRLVTARSVDGTRWEVIGSVRFSGEDGGRASSLRG